MVGGKRGCALTSRRRKRECALSGHREVSEDEDESKFLRAGLLLEEFSLFPCELAVFEESA